MKFLLFLLPLSLVLFSCGAVDDFDDDPIDEEFGVIDFERADQNSVVRPGSPEAQAVLSFVNQPIADNNAGDQFLTLIDSKLHRTAAENIVERLAGADGQFGTADDYRFPTIQALDQVPYVGRVALFRLFELARAAGFFGATIKCDDVVGNTFTTLAQLIELGNSGCNYFEGSVTIRLKDTILPAHRKLKAFDGVRRIEGELRVQDITGLDQAVFRSLQYVGLFDTRTENRVPMEFPALIEIKDLFAKNSSISFDNVEKVSNMRIEGGSHAFPNLKEVGYAFITMHNVIGFNELATGNKISIRFGHRVDGFNKLTRAQRVDMEAGSSFTMSVRGFSKLREVGDFVISSNGAPRTLITFDGLPSLEKTTGFFSLVNNSASFPKLREAGHVSMLYGFSGTLPVLQTADRIDVLADTYPFPKLERVQGAYKLLTDEGRIRASKLEYVGGTFHGGPISRYNNLEFVGGALTFECGRDWEGMNLLRKVNGLTLYVYGGTVGGFTNVEEISGTSTIDLSSGSSLQALENARLRVCI